MIQMLIFVCAVLVPPDKCGAATALDILRGPPSRSGIECAMHGQAYLAETSMRPRRGEYLKVYCRRQEKAQ